MVDGKLYYQKLLRQSLSYLQDSLSFITTLSIKKLYTVCCSRGDKVTDFTVDIAEDVSKKRTESTYLQDAGFFSMPRVVIKRKCFLSKVRSFHFYDISPTSCLHQQDTLPTISSPSRRINDLSSEDSPFWTYLRYCKYNPAYSYNSAIRVFIFTLICHAIEGAIFFQNTKYLQSIRAD